MMALTIAAASSGVAPAAAAEQAASDNSSGSDAFAGVLAGVGEPGARAGHQDLTEGRAGTRSQSAAGADAEADARTAAELADLAVLALLAPALPASTVALINSGYSAATAPSSADPGDGGSTPEVVPLPGLAPQAAEPAWQAAARRPVQAVAAQAAASAAKQARQDELPGAPVGQLPEPAAHDQPAPAAHDQPSRATAQSGQAPAGVGVGVGVAGSATLDLPATQLGGAATAAGSPVMTALVQALTVAQAGDSAMPPANQPAPANQPGPAARALAAAGALPDTAAAVAGTVGAVRGSAGAHHRSAHGPVEPEPAEPVAAAGAAPAALTPIPATAGLDPAATIAPAGSAGVQPARAVQPTAAGPGSEPVHRPPATDQPVASQVAGPVLSLRARGDGSHQLIVALHPAELGPVNVHVRITGDAMTISLASTSETAHETLRDALPQLRAELQSAGLSPASLSLDLTSGGSAGTFADPRQSDPQQSDPRQAGTVPAPDQPLLPVRSRVSGARVGAPSSSGLDRWL